MLRLRALRIVRPGNAALAAAGTLLGIVILAPHAAWSTFAASAAAAFLLAGFGNTVNDLGDVDVDRLAHPNRPLPSGHLTPRQARRLAAALLAVGLAAAAVAGLASLLIAVGNVAVLGLYEARLKARGLAGNLAVAYLVASTFLFGAAGTHTAPEHWGLVWLLAVLAFLANLARELLKDTQDMAADAATRSTFPVRHGAGPAQAAAFVAAAGAAGLGLGLALAWWRGLSPAPPWWPGWLAGLAAASLLIAVGGALGANDAARGQRLLKLGMLVAVLAFAAGAVPARFG